MIDDEWQGIKPDRIQIAPDDGAFYLDVVVEKFSDAAAILNLIAWTTARSGARVVSVDYDEGNLSVHLDDV